jgi:hypothetical protein
MTGKKKVEPVEEKPVNVFTSKDFMAAFLMIIAISIVVFFYGSSVTGQVVKDVRATTNSLFTFVFFMVGITLFFYMKSMPVARKK